MLTVKDIKNEESRLQTLRDVNLSKWQEISEVVGINVNPNDYYNTSYSNVNHNDDNIFDPSASIAVNQSGDYLVGAMVGTGADYVELVPSRWVQDKIEAGDHDINEFYKYVTSQFEFYNNHRDAGYINKLKRYSYDQFAFGTGAISTFKNRDFSEKKSLSPVIYGYHGVDNMLIDEGRSGQIETVFLKYSWTGKDILDAFGKNKKDGVIKTNIPDSVTKNKSKKYDLMLAVKRNEDYKVGASGINKNKYIGYWYLKGKEDGGNFLSVEYYPNNPVSVSRMIVVRNSVWGLSSGVMMMSTINSTNDIVENVMSILYKMNQPALGGYSNGVLGDNVIHSSAGSFTTFNASFDGGAGRPIFPIHDIGDPTGLINFLLPYLNDKISTAFKVDTLLDFNSSTTMTATEAMQRFVIRGKANQGLYTQQKNERQIPDIIATVGILEEEGLIGVYSDSPEAEELLKQNRVERIIPPIVQEVMESGQEWFDVKFKNEAEKSIDTQKVSDLLQLIQSIGTIASLYPEIVHAVDWHQMLVDINENLNDSNQIVLTASEFKELIAEQAEMQTAQAALAMASQATEIDKNAAQAEGLRNA